MAQVKGVSVFSIEDLNKGGLAKSPDDGEEEEQDLLAHVEVEQLPCP